jgi:TRAP-type mannitol/chloroaromatic compound transport system permease small subunit
MKRIIALSFFVFLSGLVPAAAFAATPSSFSDLVNQLVSIITGATFTLFTLAVVIYFWGIASGLFGASEGSGKEAANLRSYIIWGIAIIFVMFSIWGIVALLQNSFFGNAAPASTTSNPPSPDCVRLGTCP